MTHASRRAFLKGACAWPLIAAASALAFALALAGRRCPARCKLVRTGLVALLAFDLGEAIVRWNPTGSLEVFSPESRLLREARKLAGDCMLGKECTRSGVLECGAFPPLWFLFCCGSRATPFRTGIASGS